MASPFRVGLTGGVASGKSLVSSLFRDLGTPVLDADQVSREIVQIGEPALDEIAAEFGAGVLLADGSLDRRRLRELVFTDEVARRRLEKITHPKIRQRIHEWIDAQTAPYCILENAILLESGMDRLVDRVLLVDVSEELQRSRLMQRDSIESALAQKMLSAQWLREQRLERADDVLRNDAKPEDARRRVKALHKQYLQMSCANDAS